MAFGITPAQSLLTLEELLFAQGKSKDENYLDRKIELLEEGLASSTSDDDTAFTLASLADTVLMKNPPQLDRAAILYHQELTLALPPLSRMTVYRNLGDVLVRKFETGRELQTLDEALEAFVLEAQTLLALPEKKDAFDFGLETKFIEIGKRLHQYSLILHHDTQALLDRVITAFEYALRLDHFSISALELPTRLTLAIALYHKQNPECIRMFEQALSLARREQNIKLMLMTVNNLTIALLERNDREDCDYAVDLCLEAFDAVDPEAVESDYYAELHLRLGQSLFQRNRGPRDRERAERLFQQVVRVQDNSLRAEFLLAIAKATPEGHDDDIVNLCEEALRLTASPRIRAALGELFLARAEKENMPCE